MLRFTEFEALGPTVAVLSEKSDGDWQRGVDDPQQQGLCTACGIRPEDIVSLRQVHGTRIVSAGEVREHAAGHPGAFPMEADGILTGQATVALGVRVADCVPLFLYDPVKRAGGVVHAGREGTLAGIATHAVARLTGEFGVRADGLHALIGPSAGPCCYEVSEVIADAFRARGLPAQGRFLDLWASNRVQLEAAGLPSGQIHASEVCTICDGRFHSYRADGSAKRNLALFMI